MTSDAAAARRIILGYEARLNAAGADRTKVKLELYNELRLKGLDEDAELLMTFDVITRANSTNAPQPDAQPLIQPPALQPPQISASRSRRSKKIWITAVVGLLILLGMGLTPYVYTLLANHFSPVVVPNSHFVGEHGSKKKLLIFVHGVIGDMDNTWVNPETHASWPELIKEDKSLNDYDVFVYGYASPAMGDASSIEQISVRFLQQIRDYGFFDNYDEVSFVTHSMGGIITKRTLNMLNTQADGPNLQKVHTVIYISVPSNGANLAALASWISDNPQFKGMSPKNASDFLQSVEGDWANLLRQRSPSLPCPRTYSAYETLSTGPVQVVPELYTSQLSDGRVLGFDYNHINIVKPKDRDAEVYRWVKARLLEKRNQPSTKAEVTRPEVPETVWTDPQTSLMWAGKDNGKNVNWNDAERFCENLTIGNYSSWRLPDIKELSTLYDQSATAAYVYHGENYNNFENGNTYYNHVKSSGVDLESCCAWSGTKDGLSNAFYYRLHVGEKHSFPMGSRGVIRALCVRQP